MSTDQTPGTDVAYLHSSLQERKEYASALAAAGELVPSGFRDKNGAANPAKLLLAFETGVMLGLHPLAALQGIHVIEGKPTISAQLMSGIVRSKGHRLRVTSKGSIEDNTYEVTATLIRADDPSAPFTSTWNIDRARRAELFGKGNWRKYPEAMLQARAISEVARIGAPDALAGLVYTPEELGATVNEDGDVIDGEIVEDGPTLGGLVDEAHQAMNRRSETGGLGDTGNRGHASETRVSTGPDAKATRSGGSRPSPSRTVENSGAGRATPTGEAFTGQRGSAFLTGQVSSRTVYPPDETATDDGDPWLERIMAARTLEELRLVWASVVQAHAGQYPTRAGMTVVEAKDARKEALEDAEDLPPALDGIEDDGEPV